MPTRPALLLLVIPAALLACSTSPVGKQLTSEQSFIVHGQLLLTQSTGGSLNPSLTLPTQQDFVLRVDPTGKTSLAATPGQAVRSALASEDGVAFRTTEPLGLPLDHEPCGAGTSYTDFHFTVGSDGLTGTGTGTAYITQGDIAFSYSARLDFTGVPDTSGPSLAGIGADKDPLAALLLTPSEPLPPGATARLAAADERVDLTPSVPAGTGAVTAFEKPDIALRYGTTYAVTVDPWADLAGNPGAAFGEIVTIDPPPVAVEDGFEDAGATLGGAAVVDATVVPPISGAKSVLLVPVSGQLGIGSGSTRLTVRLAVTPNDRFVRFSVRPLAHFMDVGSYGSSIRVAVTGGEIASVALPSSETLSVHQTLPGGASVVMGAVRQMEVPLPAGAVDTVVFDFSTSSSPYGECGLYPPPASYLVDDLRVE